MISRKEVLRLWERRFLEKGLDSPRLSAQVLLAHVLGIDRLSMLLDSCDPVPANVLQTFEDLAWRRLQEEPVAYLVGSKEFYGLDFIVSSDVLIPRPETEGIIDLVRENFPADAALSVLDIGTGSGVLAITCAYFLRRSRVVALDVSRRALNVARVNAVRHGVVSRMLFVQADLAGACNLAGVDLVLANLPYVPESFRSAMSPEVIRYEPASALFAGVDGLNCYRALSGGLLNLKSGAILLCEIDSSQGEAMRKLFAPLARKVDVLPDVTGRDRLVAVVF